MDKPLSLIVDDEPAVRSLVADMLRREGFRTLEAADGAEALALVHGLAKDIALIVSDIRMPEMRGDALARAVRKSYPSIPILLMSGYSDEPSPSGLPFIAKPFTAAELRVVVNRILDPQTRTAPAPREV